MDLSNLRVVIVDDDVFKTADIRKALSFSGIRNMTTARNQERLWEILDQSRKNGEKVDLIITDMHYPLTSGGIPDEEAGFKLMERMKLEKINIPVIICSSRNYHAPDALGSVWYNELNDLAQGFKELLTQI